MEDIMIIPFVTKIKTKEINEKVIRLDPGVRQIRFEKHFNFEIDFWIRIQLKIMKE